jgi:hypothetical protein
MIREEWLLRALEELIPLFQGAGIELPDKALIRASCGWPSRGGLPRGIAKSCNVGETWANDCVDGGSWQVFVSPRIAHGFQALEVLVHELIHVAYPKAGHRVRFKRAAYAVGLAGKATATHAGPALAEKLQAVVDQLGPYPNPEIKPVLKPKKQTVRMRKAECPGCGYTIRTTAKWLEKGLPICGGCMVSFEPDVPLEEAERAPEDMNSEHPEWS